MARAPARGPPRGARDPANCVETEGTSDPGRVGRREGESEAGKEGGRVRQGGRMKITTRSSPVNVAEVVKIFLMDTW